MAVSSLASDYESVSFGRGGRTRAWLGPHCPVQEVISWLILWPEDTLRLGDSVGSLADVCIQHTDVPSTPREFGV